MTSIYESDAAQKLVNAVFFSHEPGPVGVSEPSETSETKDPHFQSDSSDGSDTPSDGGDGKLLAGIRDGAWLDRQNFPPLRYAVEGLIPEGFSLLIGPPKAGKSWLVLDVLLAVAAGGYAVGKIPVRRPQRVLYMAMEDGDRRMQDRCRKLLGDAPIPNLFHYLTTIEPGQVLATIQAFLGRYPDTTLIVVDTLGKVMPPALVGESAYQRDYRVAGALKRAADTYPGLSVTAIHHDRKAASEDFIDAVSGTHGLAGAADTIIVLARKRQMADAILMVTGRDVPEAEYAMKMVDGAWTLDGDTLADAAETAQRRADAAGLSDVSTAVLAFVREHGPDGVKAAQVADKFGKDAYQYLKRLEESGRLDKPKRGWYVATSPPTRASKDGALGECEACGQAMTLLSPGQTTHPMCG